MRRRFSGRSFAMKSQMWLLDPAEPGEHRETGAAVLKSNFPLDVRAPSFSLSTRY